MSNVIHFLPTYVDATPFIEQQRRYVKKPVFGREGDTVEIFDGDTLVEAEKMRSYAQYIPIYQQWLAQPTMDFNSEKGLQQGQLLVGSFLVKGKASACGYRVGGRITNNLLICLIIYQQDLKKARIHDRILAFFHVLIGYFYVATRRCN